MISSRLLSNNRTTLTQFCRYLKFFKPKIEVVPPPRKSGSEISDKNVTLLTKTQDQNTSIVERTIPFSHPLIPNRQAWVENLDTLEPNYQGIVDMHARIFGERPRVDLIYHNYRWQMVYRFVKRRSVRWQHEIRRSNRRPWPTRIGKSRQGTRRAPQFKGGVKLFGPHGPLVNYFMLPISTRVSGLCSMLSVKYAQDDLHIVNNLEIPTSDPSYLEELVETRKWGPSVLFVDVNDIMPKNISIACHEIKQFNLLPVHGLNILSMLKHDTLVLTLDALDRIEERLLYYLNSSAIRPDRLQCRPEVKGLHYYQ